jgi:hypothetical protein
MAEVGFVEVEPTTPLVTDSLQSGGIRGRRRCLYRCRVLPLSIVKSNTSQEGDTMFRITRTVRLAVLAVLVVAAALLTGSLRAATIDEDSLPTIGTSSFEFENGTVDWHFGNGTYDAHLTGTLRLNDAKGSCARLRMEYFHNGASIATKYGGSVCAADGKTHDYSVDLDPYSDPTIDLLKVSIEKQTASGGPDFSIVESTYVSPATWPDAIKITSKRVDFGGDKFSTLTSEPTRYGSVYWNRGDSGDITVRLMGYIWLNNEAGICARMNLKYYTESGTFLTEKPGGAGCAADNNLHAVAVDLQPYTSPQVGKVTVQLQTQATNGSWSVVDSQTADIGLEYVLTGGGGFS